MNIYLKKYSVLLGIIFFFLSTISVWSQTDDSINLEEIIQKFRESSSWAESVSMNIQSETLIEGSNPGHRRQKALYRRDSDRIDVIAQDCLLGKTGKLGEDSQLAISDFPRESTIEDKILINDKCYMRATKFPGGTAFGAHIQYTNYKKNLDEYLTHAYYGNFLQGVIFFGGGIINIADILSSDKEATIDTEAIGDILCYVIKVNVPQGKVIAWIAPNQGYNLLKYIIQKSSGDIFNDKLLDDTGMEESTVIVDSIKLEKIGDIFIPVSGRYTHRIIFEGGDTKTSIVKINRSDIQIRPDFETMDAFKIDLPEGTPVKIQGVPGIIYKWQEGELIASVDKYAIEQIDKVTREIVEEGEVLSPSTSNKNIMVEFNEPITNIKEESDMQSGAVEEQQEILSESYPLLKQIFILITVIIIMVVAWKVFIFRKRSL